MTEKIVAQPQPAKRPLTEDVHNRGADFLKFLLVPCVCFWAFGFPDGHGIVSALSGFAVPAFFVLTGFFVLHGDKAVRTPRLRRAALRALITFGAMFVCYLAMNLPFLPIGEEGFLAELVRKRNLFNFFVLNVWPFSIGNNIWFIQSLLYVWVFLLIWDRWGWLKYYKLIMALSMIFMVAMGELAGLHGFHILDYAYIPGGAVTRALPYTLLGMLLREKEGRLAKIRGWVYFLLFLLGAAMTLGEIIWLGRMGRLIYQGHMIGYGVMAAAACGWAVSRPHMKRTFFSIHGRRYAKRAYALANPIYCGFVLMASMEILPYPQIVMPLVGVIVYLLCLLVNVIISAMKRQVL